MASISASAKAQCTVCKKEKSAVRCEGCLQIFCYQHLADHRQNLDKELETIEMNRDLFREKLSEQIVNVENHSLMKQIDEWKEESIKKIEQAAEECKQTIIEHTIGHMKRIEIELTELTQQLKYVRQENDFNELDLTQLTNKLRQLQEDLQHPTTISIQQDTASFISKISVAVNYVHHVVESASTRGHQQASVDARPNFIDVDECPMCYWTFPSHFSLDGKREHIENHFA